MAPDYGDEQTDGRTGDSGRDEDVLFEILGNDRRRRVVGILDDVDSDIHLGELTRRILAEERSEDPADVPADVVRPVALRLHHVHLPKLRDAALVDYDHHDHIVTPRDDVAAIRDVLDDGLDR